MKRYEELDVLRGIAALAVVFCHFTAVAAVSGYPVGAFTGGRFGPHLFFIISGFVITMVLARTARAWDFVVARFSRLYPAYWLAVTLVFLRIVWLPLPDETPPRAIDFAANLTMLQSWLGRPHLDVVYWTLALELKFYALMLLVFAAGGLRRLDLVAGVWLAALAGYRLAVGPLGWSDPFVVRLALNLPYGQLFIAGIVFYQMHTVGRTWWRYALIVACLALQGAEDTPTALIVGVVLCAIVDAFARGKLAWIVCRPLVLLGTISYALYLTHNTLGSALIPLLVRAGFGLPVLMGLPLALSLAAAAAVTFGLERPANRLLRGWLSGGAGLARYRRRTLATAPAT